MPQIRKTFFNLGSGERIADPAVAEAQRQQQLQLQERQFRASQQAQQAAVMQRQRGAELGQQQFLAELAFKREQLAQQAQRGQQQDALARYLMEGREQGLAGRARERMSHESGLMADRREDRLADAVRQYGREDQVYKRTRADRVADREDRQTFATGQAKAQRGHDVLLDTIRGARGRSRAKADRDAAMDRTKLQVGASNTRAKLQERHRERRHQDRVKVEKQRVAVAQSQAEQAARTARIQQAAALTKGLFKDGALDPKAARNAIGVLSTIRAEDPKRAAALEALIRNYLSAQGYQAPDATDFFGGESDEYKLHRSFFPDAPLPGVEVMQQGSASPNLGLAQLAPQNRTLPSSGSAAPTGNPTGQLPVDVQPSPTTSGLTQLAPQNMVLPPELQTPRTSGWDLPDSQPGALPPDQDQLLRLIHNMEISGDRDLEDRYTKAGVSRREYEALVDQILAALNKPQPKGTRTK